MTLNGMHNSHGLQDLSPVFLKQLLYFFCSVYVGAFDAKIKLDSRVA